MAKFFDELAASQQTFIREQKIFFTATAAAESRINLSPKGLDSLRILGPRRIAFLNLTGSGNETAAHLADDGRITLMFCSFDGPPLILRIYGQGQAIHPRAPEWAHLRPLFGPPKVGERQIIDIAIESVQTSCGFAVPLYSFEGDRPLLDEWAERKGEEGLRVYRAEKNTRSIDGLPTHLLE